MREPKSIHAQDKGGLRAALLADVVEHALRVLENVRRGFAGTHHASICCVRTRDVLWQNIEGGVAVHRVNEAIGPASERVLLFADLDPPL